jgi:mannitol/fructose-specific phosphotransferase system IIA component (Ntr-type)
VKLARYARPECFIPDLEGAGPEEALARMVGKLREKGYLRDAPGALSRLMERERVQSTAVGDGIAIPHCFIEEVADLLIVIARSPGGVAFDSFDGRPVHVVFLLLGNTRDHVLHLKALARIARLIRATRFTERIAVAATVEEMVRAFDEEEGKI